MEDSAVVRAIRQEDLEAVARMAAALVRYHAELDPKRFLSWDGVEQGYKRFFGSQLEDPKTVLLVALRGAHRVGYAYARLEPRDWNALLDVHGALHDIFVEESERRAGVASALLDEVRARLDCGAERTRTAPVRAARLSSNDARNDAGVDLSPFDRGSEFGC
jgi:ribosomal protein S18 acetylase RimI-like enzyme